MERTQAWGGIPMGIVSLRQVDITIVPIELKENNSSLIDEGFNKASVRYAVDKSSLVRKVIANTIITRRHTSAVSNEEVDDVYEELIMYLATHEDYNPNRIAEGNIEPIPIKAFVNKIADFCTRQYLRECQRINARLVRNEAAEEIINMTPDRGQEEDLDIAEIANMESYIEALEGNRYKYKAELDLYAFLYIRLQSFDWGYDRQEQLFRIFGTTKKEMDELAKKACKDEKIQDLKIMMLDYRDEFIKHLRKHVYGVDYIDFVVRQFN